MGEQEEIEEMEEISAWVQGRFKALAGVGIASKPNILRKFMFLFGIVHQMLYEFLSFENINYCHLCLKAMS